MHTVQLLNHHGLLYILTESRTNGEVTCEAQPLYTVTACWNLHTIFGYVLGLRYV